MQALRLRAQRIALWLFIAIPLTIATWWLIGSTRLIPIDRSTIRGDELFLGEKSSDVIKRLGLKKMSMPEPAGYYWEQGVSDTSLQHVEVAFDRILSRVRSIAVIETTWSSLPAIDVIERSRVELARRTVGLACSKITFFSDDREYTSLKCHCTCDGYSVRYLVVIRSGAVDDQGTTNKVEVEFIASYEGD